MNSESGEFDLFVIGGGSGGVRAARVAAALGARVGLAEERYFGGTCVNVGCVPKKLMSYAAHYRDDFEDSRGFGWQAGSPIFDWSVFMANKTKEINRLEEIYRNMLEVAGVTLFKQRARLSGAGRIQVGRHTLRARYILIATGGWPWVPPFPGHELAITSNDLFTLKQLPGEIAIVGGGYIAVEFASILSRLGCRTRLVYRGGSLLNGFDQELRERFTTELANSLPLHLGCNIKKIANRDKRLLVSLDDGSELLADAVLTATGRRPNTADLGLEAAGIQVSDRGAITVGDDFQTSATGVFAVGDVIDRVQLTPVALAEGEIVARQLFATESPTMSYDNVPSTVFSIPNVATVGLTESQAVDRGYQVKTFSASVKQLKHTLSERQERCFIKLVVDSSSDRVLGLHMMGPDAGEIVQGFAVAMNCGATKRDFDRTIGIHPTLAEELVTMRKNEKSHG